ncbi:MAG: ATP-dependent Clp protease proteolytic subunit [Candidatus Hydrogenedentes bacterium]|nr:ATP-dependent Clp protease proteolytic subunit [Candidatus Hydrogenedentota bacterium]
MAFDFIRMDDEEDDKKNDGADIAKTETVVSRMIKSRTILIMGTIDQDVAEKTIAQLLVLDAESNEPIRVVICSPGGHVDSGFAIHDTMKFIKSPVIAIGAGWVASIAVPIMLGADKDKRYSLPHTRYLLHQPSGGVGGQASDIRIEAQEILKIRQRINKMLAEETGQPEDKVAKDSDRNFWMVAEEALAYGLVSKIVTDMKELD